VWLPDPSRLGKQKQAGDSLADARLLASFDATMDESPDHLTCL